MVKRADAIFDSLIPLLKFRLTESAFMVDINRISGLEYIRGDGDWLKIGALTRESMLDQSGLVRSRCSSW
jgi:carbon-monoxide dehydrogenase medium subunit